MRLAVFCLSLAACASAPGAKELCAELERDGVASSCRGESPHAFSALANEVVFFDLVPEGVGQVLSFESPEDYDKTVAAFVLGVDVAGPHQFGSRQHLVFVQLSEHTPLKVAERVRSAVNAL